MAVIYNDDRQRLTAQIEEWNSNRLDLFALSQPNEALEFCGVMRFFYQDEGEKVSTKCIRVSSTATTRDIMATLVEKFRPDLRMLSRAQYALYEVHVNGEERPLKDHERPLIVQLNWGNDDREGRFLLKKESDPTLLPPSESTLSIQSPGGHKASSQAGSFRRKLSKREKKELKKKEKEMMASSGKENDSSVAQQLYNELPESSFTRSISNPELVMRKRRQLKLEKKLQQIRSNDGGPDSGGTLKIYGHLVNPDVPYKTLLLSVGDNAAHVVRETLEKYGMDKETTDAFCLVEVIIPPEGPDVGKEAKECVLHDDDCPLAILLQHPPSKGTVMFQLRRRTEHQSSSLRKSGSVDDVKVPRILPAAVQSPGYNDSVSGWIPPPQYISADIGREVTERDHRHHSSDEAGQRRAAASKGTSKKPKTMSTSSADFETTFDVDGHVETVAGQPPIYNQSASGFDLRHGPPAYESDMLPGMLSYSENVEDQLIVGIIGNNSGAAMQFRLAPAYTLYLVLRSCASSGLSVMQRDRHLSLLADKMAQYLLKIIECNQLNPGSLSFWLANTSELLHFVKQDRDIGAGSIAAQNHLADIIRQAFSLLTTCLQSEIACTMPAFLNQDSDDLNDPKQRIQGAGPTIGDVVQILNMAMTLLRRCRVNAALTIQLFSQLFHFINMWLFNYVVLQPKLQLCSHDWGARFHQRLAHVQAWAEQQGLELAADCHLAKVVQMALLLHSPKTLNDMTSLMKSCDSLNSAQLRALLCNYYPAPGERTLSSELVGHLVMNAASTVDLQLQEEGREVSVEEPADLNLPFLVPEDGYSCEFVRGMPAGLVEFVDQFVHSGLCRLVVNPNSSGHWTIYMSSKDDMHTYQNLKSAAAATDGGSRQEPEIVNVTFNKVNNSLGLSIVAAKSEFQDERAIYIKSVVAGGAAERDGRLQAGDQLLAVNGHSLVGVAQETAAKIMASSGQQVMLTVAKQGAVCHGLAMLICQEPAQTLPTVKQLEGPPRPASQYDQRRMPASDGSGYGTHPKPLNQQMEAVSTPVLTGLKKEPTSRDMAAPPVSSVASMSLSSRLDSSRAASTSHPDLMQLRQPGITPQRRGESAVSRLAPKITGPNPQLGSDSSTEVRLGSDSVNNQRVIEWQMRNQMAKDSESAGQIHRRFESEPNSTVAVSGEQRPNYYPSRPQSQLVEPGYMPRPAKPVFPLSQSSSMPMIADSAVANRGQMAASFGQQSSAAEMYPVSMPVYSDDQRRQPQQLPPSMYDQRLASSIRPQFNHMANVRPQMSEIVRHPLPGMVPQDVHHPSLTVHSNLPDVRQQPPVIGDSIRYRPSGSTAGPTITISSEQRPNYYPSRPQSQVIEPGYMMPRPAKPVSPLSQSISTPVIADSAVANRGQMAASFGQQSSAAEMYPVSTPVYSDDQRRQPQQPQPNMYDQQLAMSVQPQLNQMANVRPQMSEVVRHPLPGMVPHSVRHPSPVVHSNLPGIYQQPAVIGTGMQYRPSSGQITTSSAVVSPTGVRYGVANDSGGMPAVSSADGRPLYTAEARYGPPQPPDIYDSRSAPPQDMRYEMANVEYTAVSVGVSFSNNDRPYAAHEGPYGTPHGPEPADIRYGMPSVAGVIPSVRPVVLPLDVERNVPQADVRYGTPNVGGEMPPGVRYNSSGSQSGLAEAEPSSSHEPSRNQSAMKFNQQGGYYGSSNAAVCYSSQEPPYGIHSVSGSTSVVPANILYKSSSPINTGDSWPLPPATEHYGALSVQSEFPVPPSSIVPPPNSRFSAPQIQNATGVSKPLPSVVRPMVQNVITTVPSLPPWMPTNDVRPKKQPPPVAAKPKLPVSTGMAARTKEISKDEGKLKPEKIQQKMLEIQRLESRPYLTANEQTKLQKLRVEVEFDKRLADMNDTREGDSEQHTMLPKTHTTTVIGEQSQAALQQSTVESTYRPSDEVHQQQAAQPFVYVPTMLTYNDRPPAAAVDQSGERFMSLEASNSHVSVSNVPGNEQLQPMQSWEAGRVMPAPSSVSSAFAESETVPSTSAPYAPYQTFTAEQRSGSLPPYVAASQTEDWKQYDAAYTYWQPANPDMQRYPAMTAEYRPEYYDNRQNVAVDENVGESEIVRPTGLEVSTSTVPLGRGSSSSALRQPASTPGSSKKSVTFHENIATEYAFHQSYGSTSSENSFIALSPPMVSGGYDSVTYQGPVYSYGAPVPR